MKLRDPELCPTCHRRGRVVRSDKRVGYRRRVHYCAACNRRWPSYQSRIHPRRVHAAA